MAMQILQSEVVSARRSKWRVADVRSFARCQLLTLVGVDPWNRGFERRLLAPFDIVRPVHRRLSPQRISMRLWRRACRALLTMDTSPATIRSLLEARIDLLPYQIEPALALVRGLGMRVLLADEVGLGKTIQAGLIVCELTTRGAADRVLIVTPAGLRDQWAAELHDRFGLSPVVVDARSLGQALWSLPVGANPWQAASLVITSVDYIKRADVLADLTALRWDVIVVDEAHGVASDSDRHRAVSILASRTPFVVLLTATPHNGDRDAFASLCRLGAVENDDGAGGKRPLLVFRRTRQVIGLDSRRRVHGLCVRPTADEARMHRSLERFVRAVREERGVTRTKDPDHPVSLALSVLRKRAWSSASSLLRSVERRLIASPHLDSNLEGQLELPLGDPTGELSLEDAPPPWSPLLTLHDANRERSLLRAIQSAAALAAVRESKIAALRRLLRRVSEPAVVFTEYRDTLLHVQAFLDQPSALLHGGLTRAERLHAIERFTTGAIRVLLATDAAGEGLNLHRRCRIVINFELPWNPMRLEQRIGRVDRLGQSRRVHAFHLIGRGTAESSVLARLQERLARARADIGSPAPLGGEQSGDQSSSSSAGLTCPTLALEAGAEVRRIEAARRMLRALDREALEWIDAKGSAAAVSRRASTRKLLGRQLLAIWRIDARDSAGRTIWSRVVAALVDRAMANPLDPALGQRLAQSTDSDRAGPMALFQAFLVARLARERALLAHLAAEADELRQAMFQPGLFDRRTERARRAAATSIETFAADQQMRIASLEQALVGGDRTCRLMLTLSAY